MESMTRLDSQHQLDAAVDIVIACEPRFHATVLSHGYPRLRRMTPGLASLLRIVTDQLISLKAGEAIWARIACSIDPADAQSLAVMPEHDLMRLGLSGGKARTFQAAARAIMDGNIDFDALEQAPDQEVLARLQSIKGIGPWTADIYLLMAMGRADAWPKGDLALQVAAQSLLGLEGRPAPREMERLSIPWQPHRAAAAHLLWSHYRGLKGLKPAAS